jgi:hypothetical protein
MRIVATACLVLAILFMVGCGTSAEDKKMIQDQGTKLANLEKGLGDVQKIANPDLQKKIADIEAFLTKQFPGKYPLVPDTIKKAAAPTGKKAEPPKKTEPPKEPTGKKGEPTKGSGTGK